MQLAGRCFPQTGDATQRKIFTHTSHELSTEQFSVVALREPMVPFQSNGSAPRRGCAQQPVRSLPAQHLRAGFSRAEDGPPAAAGRTAQLTATADVSRPPVQPTILSSPQSETVRSFQVSTPRSCPWGTWLEDRPATYISQTSSPVQYTLTGHGMPTRPSRPIRRSSRPPAASSCSWTR